MNTDFEWSEDFFFKNYFQKLPLDRLRQWRIALGHGGKEFP